MKLRAENAGWNWPRNLSSSRLLPTSNPHTGIKCRVYKIKILPGAVWVWNLVSHSEVGIYIGRIWKQFWREYEGVSKSFRTGCLERELQMVQLSATRCTCIAILWVSLVSFDATTLCVASERVFTVVSVYFVIDRKFICGTSRWMRWTFTGLTSTLALRSTNRGRGGEGICTTEALMCSKPLKTETKFLVRPVICCYSPVLVQYNRVQLIPNGIQWSYNLFKLSPFFPLHLTSNLLASRPVAMAVNPFKRLLNGS
jgi:hypothetical protein